MAATQVYDAAVRELRRDAAQFADMSARPDGRYLRGIDLYDVLEVSPEASDDEIRRAYRALARRYHPDHNGTGVGADMARINAAYQVLGTPARRAVYDDGRRPHPAAPAAGPTVAAPTGAAHGTRWTSVDRTVPVEPARFPWRFTSVLAGLGIGAAIAFAALNQPEIDVPVHDQVIEAGSCVFVQGTGRVVEVTCGSADSRTVVTVVSSQAACPPGLLRYRTIDPEVNACVERAG